MYLRRLVCTNIRGFESLDINLCPMYQPMRQEQKATTRVLSSIDDLLNPDSAHVRHRDPFPGWTVITGDNGSGKSTVLKSIALALMGPDKARYLQTSYDGWVTAGADHGSVSLEVKPDGEIDKTRAGGRSYKTTFWAEVDIERDDEQPGGSTWVLTAGDHFKNGKKGAQSGPWQLTTAGWLGIGYGPFRRLYGSSSTAAGLEADPQKARFATLFLEDATLIEAEKWLQELDYQSARGANPEQRGRAAEQLAAVTEMLSADFLRNGMRFDAVDADGVWLHDPEERRLRLSDMSEGYRAALAMLIDIIRHIFLAYEDAASRMYRDSNDLLSLHVPAVVLIDEIDAHLHPAWQREIGGWLTSHFPLIQFIVTTHSPLVCQAATGGRVYILPAPGQDHAARAVTPQEYERLMNGDATAILASPAFGLSTTKSFKLVRAMKRHARLQQLSLFEVKDDQQEYEQLELFFEGRLAENV